MRTSRHQLLLSALCAAICTLGAGAAPAADLYMQGQLAISGGQGKSGGATEFFANSGSDSDSSPVFGGAFGYEFPLHEMLPLDWDTNMPYWPIRLEFEALGGRDYELITDGGDPYLTNVTQWAVTHNLWMDFPVHAPVSWALGRVPVLEPMSFTLGAGVGVSGTDLKTTNNVFSGKDDAIGFTWLVGAGFGYRLTDRVSLALGYRFTDLGEYKYDLFNAPAPDPVGDFTMKLYSHELMFNVRVNFYTVPSPGAWGRPRAR